MDERLKQVRIEWCNELGIKWKEENGTLYAWRWGRWVDIGDTMSTAEFIGEFVGFCG